MKKAVAISRKNWKNGDCIRDNVSRGFLPIFNDDDCVLVATIDFHEGYKLCLFLRRPRRVVKGSNDFFPSEVARKWFLEKVHVSRLMLYSDKELKTKVTLPRILQNETGTTG